jgi:hypothetical protein
MPVVDFYVEYQRKNNRNVGRLLVEGELVDEKEERIVTCGLDTFDAFMRKVYPDWDAFTDWALERTGRYGRWWEIAG